MKSQKGFTLIELLAVIVVLSIIAIIATPQILGVIDKARIGAAESSAIGYIDAIEKQVAINLLNTNQADDINEGNYQISDLVDKNVKVKGKGPTKGCVVINDKGIVTDFSLLIDKYVVNKVTNERKAIAELGTEDNLSEICSGGSNQVASGPTKVDAQIGETHKGIIYLDPTDLTKTCDESSTESNYTTNGTNGSPTEIKTGCMKWYIFDDSNNEYKMILDHNTTARIKWNDSNSNVAYNSSNPKSAINDLVTTSGWKITPRIISAGEVNLIVNRGGFNVSDGNNWYYLDTGTRPKKTFTDTDRSSYDWLYNYMNICKTDSVGDWGCTIEDNNSYTGYGTAASGNTFGYWTSTPIGSPGNSNSVWAVTYRGALSWDYANGASYGVRPVISIPKSLFVNENSASTESNINSKYAPGNLVYFDPVSTNQCDSKTFNLDAVKSGTSTCYKWRIITVDYDDTKEDITLQLDHNLVNKSFWSPINNNSPGPTTALKALETATSGWTRLSGLTYSYDTTEATNNYGILSCTNGACKIGNGANFTSNLKARMITGEEIRAITLNEMNRENLPTGGTGAYIWSIQSFYLNWFYFSNSTYLLGTKTSGTGSTYLAWLVENTVEGTYSLATLNMYGDTNIGYWTLTPHSGGQNNAWAVFDEGYLDVRGVTIDADFGVRPVITISKTLLAF